MLKKIKEGLSKHTSQMIGAMEKGIEAAKIQAPLKNTFEGTDLRHLPKFICYKAALLRQRGTLELVIGLMAAGFAVYFVTSRFEISSLYERLRAKEYILAPGVIDFTPAAAQSVSDEYVAQAVMEFVSQFVSVNPVNIDERFDALASSMSSELQVKFRSEAGSWQEKVKQDNLFEMGTLLSKQIESDGKGNYRVLAKVKTSSFVGSEHIGVRDEVIEMSLRLVPPRQGKRWFLEISSLSKSSGNSFNVKKSFGE